MTCRKSTMTSEFRSTLMTNWLNCDHFDRKQQEIQVLESTIEKEKDKQNIHIAHMKKRAELLMLMRWVRLECRLRNENNFFCRFALQHIIDVLRHVGSPDLFKPLEYPTFDLKLPLLKFNANLPQAPLVMDTDGESPDFLICAWLTFFIFTAPKLLASTKSRVQLLMQHYRKEKKPEEVNEAQATFEEAMIEDSMRTFRPRNISLDFDWVVSSRTHRSKHLIGFRKSQEKTKRKTSPVSLIFRAWSRPLFGFFFWVNLSSWSGMENKTKSLMYVTKFLLLVWLQSCQKCC